MANPVRKLLPRSLDPRQNVGQPTFEADLLVEDPPGADDEDRSTTGITMPDGSIVPRFKPFRAKTTPPAPSPSYRVDPRYVLGNDFHNETHRRALANHRAWTDFHSGRWHPTVNWLIANDCAGEPVKAAREELRRVSDVAKTATTRLADAQARAAQAETALVDQLRQGGRLPAGDAVLAARREVEAAQLVADTAAGLEPAAKRAHQTALGRINWREALALAETKSGPEADDACAWLRAELNPPVSPTDDPLAWL